MNHIRRNKGASACAVPTPCHPERSLEASTASRQTQSKDPEPAEVTTDKSGNFHIVVRFFDDHEAEMCDVPSREAAKERSPRRKPWEK